MRIDTFKIEEWMNHYCPEAKYDLTTTCIEPLSIRDLLTICSITNASEITHKKLSYGDIHGSDRLINSILSLYKNQKTDNITVTHGGIGANQLIFESLLDKNDEVLVILPAYQQHYSIPKAIGAKVNTMFLREENSWQPNLVELEKNLTFRTRLICLTNPNNPTGAVIPDETLRKIAEIAKERNIWVLADEVYRGLNMTGNPYSEAFADIYGKGISVGSMSKTYSLPGLRVGWIVAREDLIKEINKHREYNTISVSILDDYFASLALENRDKIAARNFKIMREGLDILKDWQNGELYVKVNLPQGGTTALVRYKKEIPSKTLCREFQAKTGVALLPGETMDMEGTVRVGFCSGAEALSYGLKQFSKYLRTI